MNSFGLFNTMFGGKVMFDKNALSLYYKGGLIDHFYDPTWMASGFSPHVITGNSNVGEVFDHELHHLWHSRALNDLFLVNYGLQGLNALILGGNFVERYNYYEDFIDLNKTKWW